METDTTGVQQYHSETFSGAQSVAAIQDDFADTQSVDRAYPQAGEEVDEGEIVDVYFDPLATPEPTPDPNIGVKGERVEVTDVFQILGSDEYANFNDKEIIKFVIEVIYSDTGKPEMIENTNFNKDTLPRSINFKYDVPVDGSTEVVIFINNKRVKRYTTKN